jgi:hypothetical protein
MVELGCGNGIDATTVTSHDKAGSRRLDVYAPERYCLTIRATVARRLEAESPELGLDVGHGGASTWAVVGASAKGVIGQEGGVRR